MLGDALSLARRSGNEAMLAHAPPGLADPLDAFARTEGVGRAQAARIAVADFSRFADEEDWATLISHIRTAVDPAVVCLTAILDWRLRQLGCAEHGSKERLIQ